MVGLAEFESDHAERLHGLRHPESADMTGWFIWAGELSSADDFFKCDPRETPRSESPSLLAVPGAATRVAIR